MKQLFFIIVVLTTFACQKQEVDCSDYRAKCTYIQFNYSDCTPNGSELGWEWDAVRSDTSIALVHGCPDKLNRDFQEDQERTFSDPATPVSVKKFMEQYPSSCNCE